MNGENAIDFPCSYSWRSYYQETFYGEYLPRIEPHTKIEEQIKEPPAVVNIQVTPDQLKAYKDLNRRIKTLETKMHIYFEERKQKDYF